MGQLFNRMPSSGGGVDLTQSNATPSDVLIAKKFFSNGSELVRTGTMPAKTAQTYTPTTSNIVIPAGQYLSEAQTIIGDSDLVAGNIKQGVNLFGVVGTMKPFITETITSTPVNNFATISGLSFSKVIALSYSYMSIYAVFVNGLGRITGDTTYGDLTYTYANNTLKVQIPLGSVYTYHFIIYGY